MDMVRRLGTTALLTLLAASASSPEATEVFRWTDEAGLVHYGDQPRPGAKKLLVGTAGPALRRVGRILDGDTIELDDGTRVRLIGLNTPEIAHRGNPAEPGAIAAHQYLSERLEGALVRIVPGRQKRDRYDRLLAHVFKEAVSNIGAELLRKGYATVNAPNLLHAEAYFTAEKSARHARRGLWASGRFSVRPVSQAAALRNRYCRLRGRITAVDTKRTCTYIRFGDNLTAAVPNESLPLFTEAGKEVTRLRNRLAVVRGWVRQRDGTPFLQLLGPLQIEQ